MQKTKPVPNRWSSLAVLCIVLFMAAVDNTVLNTALPSIARSLESSAGELQWIADAYTLVFAAFLLTLGAIGDRYGRKRILLTGLLIFGVVSFVATLSVSSTQLILSRAVLGFGGAMIMPATLSIITAIFHDPKERARAIAIWTAMFAIGAGIGPLIGGYLLITFSWTAVFYLNLPITLICFIAIARMVPESCDERAPRVDFWGSILSIIGLLTLVYGIIHAGEQGWTEPSVLVSFAIALVTISAFIWWERHTPEPMLPLEFFKNPSFTGSSLAVTLNNFGMFGALYFMSQYLQTVMGHSALNAAIGMMPMNLMVFITTPVSVILAEKIGYKVTIACGMFIAAVGMLILSLSVSITMPYIQLAVVLIIFSTGLGLIVSPATNAIMTSVPVERAGVGSAVNDMLREIGGALGVAVFGALMNATYRGMINELDVIAGLPEQTVEMIRSSIQTAHIAAEALPASMAQVSEAILNGANNAFVTGMTEATSIAVFIMVAAGIFALIVIPLRPKLMTGPNSEVLPVPGSAD